MICDALRPSFVSTAVAGRLLGFNPPAAFHAHLLRHPREFPNTTSPRRIALSDLEKHPFRHGRPISLADIMTADREQESDRARFRHYNNQRKQRRSR
jgi:hypothetical protein